MVTMERICCIPVVIQNHFLQRRPEPTPAVQGGSYLVLGSNAEQDVCHFQVGQGLDGRIQQPCSDSAAAFFFQDVQIMNPARMTQERDQAGRLNASVRVPNQISRALSDEHHGIPVSDFLLQKAFVSMGHRLGETVARWIVAGVLLGE